MIIILFSINPKQKRSELFNREEEYEKLNNAINNARIILLDGLRRIGKTSLLKVFLNETENLHILIDCRMFYKNNNIKPSEINKAIFESIKKEIKGHKLKKAFEKLSSISFGGFQLSLNTNKNAKTLNLAATLNEINEILHNKKRKFIIAFDEAQYLRYYNKGGEEFLQLMAYAYDNLENIIFILTGSEVGLLHEFINIENISAPLYGRYISEITLQRFKRDKSIEFLKKGFEVEKIKLTKNELETAVDELDGIVGYLSMFGFILSKEKNSDFYSALNKTKEMAGGLVLKEINSLINLSINYGYVLKAISFGMRRYSKIKKFIDLNYGGITDTTLSKILSSLVKQNFIQIEYKKTLKEYSIPDPIIQKTSENLELE